MQRRLTPYTLIWAASMVLAGAMLNVSACGTYTAALTSVTRPETTAQPARSPGVSDTLGTIHGRVVAQPTCPVESVAHPCPPRPVQGVRVSVAKLDGQNLPDATTNASGEFDVHVPSGMYYLHVTPPPGLRLMGTHDIVVSVSAGVVSDVTITLDTGIR